MGNANANRKSQQERCGESLGVAAYAPADATVPYCNGTFDGVLCWPSAPAGTEVSQNCPPLRGVDASNLAYRRCSPRGFWEGNPDENVTQLNGWTNYTTCYTEAGRIMTERFADDLPKMKAIAFGARILEFVGLCTSFLTLAISIFIFCYYRSLRCDRTRIHRHLFLAIIIHVAIMLIKHVDSFIAWKTGEQMGGAVVGPKGTVYETMVLCESLETLVEYTKTVMFMWMFIEGMYLHNMLVISVFSSKPNYILYNCMGWGIPFVPTGAWAVTNALLNKEKCWYNYQFKPYYWILEGPRIAIITVNIVFLLNIIRVLVTKLRENNSTEALQVRKAVKAAIVLLPLLGLNNFLAFGVPPGRAVPFGIWSICSTFLVSFQGFFISVLYCFLNGEVQNTVRRHWDRYQQKRGGYTSGRRRLSRTLSVFTSVTEVPNHQIQTSQQVKASNGTDSHPMYSPDSTRM